MSLGWIRRFGARQRLVGGSNPLSRVLEDETDAPDKLMLNCAGRGCDAIAPDRLRIYLQG